MNLAQLKRKLRELKKFERQLRFGDDLERTDLAWDRFFSTENAEERAVKYPLAELLAMDKSSWKQVVEEYFYHLFYCKYKESGLTTEDIYDPVLLAAFGLPPNATLDMVKAKFRALAKRHHPDLGGDHDKMIELLETYRQLTSDK